MRPRKPTGLVRDTRDTGDARTNQAAQTYQEPRRHDPARAIHLSKLLALALRHDPSALGVSVDAEGWVRMDDIIAGFAERGKPVTRDELRSLVDESDKKRFAISGDGERIRANQGHSIDVDLGLSPTLPPITLYHGTVVRVAEAIRREGLVRRARAHVHLSSDMTTAEIVAFRREGPHIVFRVRAREMHEAGYAFFLSENGVWLTEHVPAVFLEE